MSTRAQKGSRKTKGVQFLWDYPFKGSSFQRQGVRFFMGEMAKKLYFISLHLDPFVGKLQNN